MGIVGLAVLMEAFVGYWIRDNLTLNVIMLLHPVDAIRTWRRRMATVRGLSNRMTDFSPREIVSELDRFIVGQSDGKRAVAIALRNRWRRLQLDDKLRDEVLPKNILMIGPTGVGKTEISRRLARLAGAPFLKVEATKFTEVGYVGRDVEQIVRDLVEIGIGLTREAQAQGRAGTRRACRGGPRGRRAWSAPPPARRPRNPSGAGCAPASSTTRKSRSRCRSAIVGHADVRDSRHAGRADGRDLDRRYLRARWAAAHQDAARHRAESHDILINEESDKLLDNEQLVQELIKAVEQNGIVFLDEIDKIARGSDRRGGADVSREGVQRDLLPLIEGTTVSTKHGPVKTDHILFIASGAFHLSKPSDLLPELQGRLPIRVELKALTRDDFRRILTEPEASLIKQYVALMATEGVTLEFTDDAIDAIADVAVSVNSSVENIGARRLQTVMERVLDEISFAAPDRTGETVKVDAAYVQQHVGDLAKNADLSRFIL